MVVAAFLASFKIVSEFANEGVWDNHTAQIELLFEDSVGDTCSQKSYGKLHLGLICAQWQIRF